MLLITGFVFSFLFYNPVHANECRAITDCSGGNCVARTVCSNQPRSDPRLKKEIEKIENERRMLERERRALESERSRKQAEQNQPLRVSVTSSPVQDDGSVLIQVQFNKDVSSIQIDGYEEGGRDSGKYSFKRVPRVGTNTTYEVTIIDSFGNQQVQSVSVERKLVRSSERFSKKLQPTLVSAKKKENAIAIIIGISNYKRIPAAEYADNDAKMFYDYATRALGVNPENIKLLVNDQADRIGIRRTLDNWLVSRTDNNTEIYFFYSGHGFPSADGGKLFFLPWDSDIDYLEDTAISQSLVFESLQKANPKSVTLFVDSCYSGQSRSGETLLAGVRPIVWKKKPNALPKKFNIFTASGLDQISSSSQTLKHGIFSFYLMKGMEGEADTDKNKKISLGELAAYLKTNVNKEAASINRKQVSEFLGQESKVIVEKVN